MPESTDTIAGPLPQEHHFLRIFLGEGHEPCYARLEVGCSAATLQIRFEARADDARITARRLAHQAINQIFDGVEDVEDITP